MCFDEYTGKVERKGSERKDRNWEGMSAIEIQEKDWEVKEEGNERIGNN